MQWSTSLKGKIFPTNKQEDGLKTLNGFLCRYLMPERSHNYPNQQKPFKSENIVANQCPQKRLRVMVISGEDRLPIRRLRLALAGGRGNVMGLTRRCEVLRMVSDRASPLTSIFCIMRRSTLADKFAVYLNPTVRTLLMWNVALSYRTPRCR